MIKKENTILQVSIPKQLNNVLDGIVTGCRDLGKPIKKCDIVIVALWMYINSIADLREDIKDLKSSKKEEN